MSIGQETEGQERLFQPEGGPYTQEPLMDVPVQPRLYESFIKGSDDWHVISADQFIPGLLPEIFQRADELRGMDATLDGRREMVEKHKGLRIGVTFHEPSTRTDFSFRTAAMMLGMDVVHTNAAGIFSSAAKGETIEDNAHTLDQMGYSAVVIRHGESGSLSRAARASETPIINAGDGPGEHPTQALLDAYTIHREFGTLDDRHIVFGGDLRYGRTVHSLARLMSRFHGTRVTFASVPWLAATDEVKDVLHKSGTPFTETNDVYDALRDPSIDVVYWTRTQKERMPQPDNRIYAQAKHFGGRAIQAVRKWWSDPEPEPQMGFVLNPDTIKDLSVDARIMHPLPRVDEIDTAIDHDLRSIFFPQVKNGLYAREALLDIIAEQNILGLL